MDVGSRQGCQEPAGASGSRVGGRRAGVGKRSAGHVEAGPAFGGDRWQTLGSAGGLVVLFVVHTEPVEQPDGTQVGRVISVRKATLHERKTYEEGASEVLRSTRNAMDPEQLARLARCCRHAGCRDQYERSRRTGGYGLVSRCAGTVLPASEAAQEPAHRRGRACLFSGPGTWISDADQSRAAGVNAATTYGAELSSAAASAQGGKA